MSADYDRLFGPPEPEDPDDAPRAADPNPHTEVDVAQPTPGPPPVAAAEKPLARADFLDLPGRPMHNGHNPSGAADMPLHTGQASPPTTAATAAAPIDTPYRRPAPPVKPIPPVPPPRSTEPTARRSAAAGRHARRPASDPTPEPKPARRGAATHHRAIPQRRPATSPPTARRIVLPANYNEPTRRLPTSRPARASATGWRRGVYLLTRINLGPSRAEKYALELRARITRSPRRTYQIGVLGLQGGAGKTTVTVTLASAFADVRGGQVLAIDADPASGNLADRVGRTNPASIADLAASNTGPRYADVRALASTNAVNLDVLAAAAYGRARRGLSETDWRCAAEAAAGAYDVVLADCGGDFFDPATRAVLSTVDAIALVATPSADGARQAAVAIDWLRTNGYRRLLTGAHIVINHVLPGKPPAQMTDLIHEFDEKLSPGRVVTLPYDRHIAAGGAIAFASLDDVYRRRTLQLAADLADDFNKVVTSR